MIQFLEGMEEVEKRDKERTFSQSEVEELLKQQRELCAETYSANHGEVPYKVMVSAIMESVLTI